MSRIITFALALLSLTRLSLYGEEKSSFTINLQDPVYRDGVIETVAGGVIEGSNLRIQARHIKYTHRKDTHFIVAEGDLMVLRDHRVFVGSRLEYDVKKQSGVVYNGVTQIGVWFIGGDRIFLSKERGIEIEKGTISTSESRRLEWSIYAKRVQLTPDQYLLAENIQARVGNFPILWLPGFRSNLNLLLNPPVRYKLLWDRGQGPRLTMRYRVYSWENANLFLRLDLRPHRGIGGALESTYEAPDHRTLFLTRNYLAHDTFYNDDDPNKKKTRYRLQGLLTSHSPSEKTSLHLSYDRISDRNMPGDFRSNDFEVNTAKRTELRLRHFEDYYLFGLNVRPRINSYESLTQELPLSFLSFKPIDLAKVGIITENRFRAAFLDYVTANQVSAEVPDFNSMRLAMHNALYRPIPLRYLTITPRLGFEGIIYSKSPEHGSLGQAVLRYDVNAHTKFFGRTQRLLHTIEPYLNYEGIAAPATHTDKPFIFSIRDGWHRLNVVRGGMMNAIYLHRFGLPVPTFSADLYGLYFSADNTFSKAVPKAFGHFTWNIPYLSCYSLIGYNFQDSVFDVTNVGCKVTVNQHIAFWTEFRHRSRFYWRKDQKENYILDVARSIPRLLDSPLSDGRNTFLGRLEMQLAPEWTLRVQSHFGWGRGGKEPAYREAKVDLITMLTSAWRAQITYMHTVRDDRISFGITMVRK